jgi:hypothetical protein
MMEVACNGEIIAKRRRRISFEGKSLRAGPTSMADVCAVDIEKATADLEPMLEKAG